MNPNIASLRVSSGHLILSIPLWELYSTCCEDLLWGTLQNQLPAHTAGEPMSRVTIVSCALFRDAASAAVIGGR